MCEKTKVCTKCKDDKSFDEFDKGNDEHSLKFWCRTCFKKWSKERTKKIKDSEHILVENKICSACKVVKEIGSFNKNSCSIDNHQNVCKQCRKEYRDNNKDKISKGIKKWVENNKEYVSETNKNYRLENIESIRAVKRVYESNKRKTNILFKLSSSIRRNIKYSFTNSKTIKNKNTLSIIGCSIEEFKAHIESQFLPWMNWDNYGNICGNSPEYNCSWDLDHIIPISSAKTEEEVYLLNHWSNFQPLCSRVNRWDKKDNLIDVSNIILNITCKKNTKNSKK